MHSHGGEVVAKPSGHLVPMLRRVSQNPPDTSFPMLRVGMHTDPAHKYHNRMEPPKTLPGSGSFSCCQIRMHSHGGPWERGNGGWGTSRLAGEPSSGSVLQGFATASGPWERGKSVNFLRTCHTAGSCTLGACGPGVFFNCNEGL